MRPYIYVFGSVNVSFLAKMFESFKQIASAGNRNKLQWLKCNPLRQHWPSNLLPLLLALCLQVLVLPEKVEAVILCLTTLRKLFLYRCQEFIKGTIFSSSSSSRGLVSGYVRWVAMVDALSHNNSNSESWLWKWFPFKLEGKLQTPLSGSDSRSHLRLPQQLSSCKTRSRSCILINWTDYENLW